MKLACDIMLGSLARWLRICGVDAFYDAALDRSGLFRVARQEGRTILTRAGNFGELKDIPPYIVIEDEDLEGQLKQVKKAFPAFDPFALAFTRCVECNVLLQKVDKAAVRDLVPARSFERHEEFFRCPSCRKIFWPGTHLERMTRIIKQIFSA